MSMPHFRSAAYRWWNSQIDDAVSLDSIPEIVLPQVARSVWGTICPLFLLFVIDEQDVQTYWESIQSVVSMFDSSRDIPNPLAHFPEFISKVYSLQGILFPRTVTESICFVERFDFHDAAHFVLYQSPVFLFDPVLYLDTLLFLRQRNHHLWSRFIGNEKLAEAFFELYRTFLTPIEFQRSGRAWKHRFLLTELFACLISDVLAAHAEVFSVTFVFLDLAIPLLEMAPYECAIGILRAVMGTIAAVARTVSRDQLAVRVTKLITTLDGVNSPFTPMVIHFATTIRPALIKRTDLVRMIATRGLRSLDDLEVLAAFADPVSAISVFSLLIKFALGSKVFCRACWSTVQGLLQRFARQSEVHDWFLILIRRLFVFIALAHARKKYRMRSLLICEALSTLIHSGFPWVQQAITASASGIGTRPVPAFFRCFFQITLSVVDDLSLHEFGLFAQCPVHLKTFPFDHARNVLLVPPTREAIAAVPRIAARPRISVSQRDERLPLGSKKKIAKNRKKTAEPALIKKPSQGGRNRPFTPVSETRLGAILDAKSG
jgi:hypothetical protein